jgi:hypothetical protein
MYDPNPAGKNRYLYHWLSAERLERFASRGTLRPYWKHWVYDLGGFARGISASFSPVEWMPREDEGAPGEPCLVIDRSAFDHRSVELWSGETYHLTKRIASAIRQEADIEPILARIPATRQRTFATMDEVFILDPIPAQAVAAIGFEPDRMYWEDLQAITAAAERWSVPLIRMDGWLDSSPDIDELDAVIERAIENPHERRYF